MNLQPEFAGQRGDRPGQPRQGGSRGSGLAGVDNERQPLVLDPHIRVRACFTEQAREASAQLHQLRWLVRHIQVTVLPILGAVEPGHSQPRHLLQAAEFYYRTGVTTGDDRHRRAPLDQLAERLQRAGRQPRIRRVGHDRREGAIEVHCDQGMSHVGSDLGGHGRRVPTHTLILPSRSDRWVAGSRTGDMHPTLSGAARACRRRLALRSKKCRSRAERTP